MLIIKVEFWIETQSGKYEEICEIKTKKMSKRDETAYKAKMNVKEDGYYIQYM
jgi:hypothetical protein